MSALTGDSGGGVGPRIELDSFSSLSSAKPTAGVVNRLETENELWFFGVMHITESFASNSLPLLSMESWDRQTRDFLFPGAKTFSGFDKGAPFGIFPLFWKQANKSKSYCKRTAFLRGMAKCAMHGCLKVPEQLVNLS